MRALLRWFVEKVVRPRWVVSLPCGDHPGGEMGVLIFGVPCFYYKWSDPLFASYPWRIANKREFGEVVRSWDAR